MVQSRALIATAALAVAVAGIGVALRHDPRSRPAAIVVGEPSAEASPSPTPEASPSPTPESTSPPSAGPSPAAEPSDDPTPEPTQSRRTAYLPPGLEVTLRAEPPSATTGEMVTFVVDVSDTDGSPMRRWYDYGDGTAYHPIYPMPRCVEEPEYVPDYRGQPSHVTYRDSRGFRRAGTFTVRVTVETGAWCSGIPHETKTVEVVVRIDGPPVSNGPHRVDVHGGFTNQGGGASNLWVSGSDEDGWIHRVVVDPGDGRPSFDVDVGGLDGCREDETGWPASRESWSGDPGYTVAGRYEGTVTMHSAGCDGADEQVASMTFVAEYQGR